MAEYNLKDKVALITGANSGIGASTARAFASEGAVVVVHYLEKSVNKQAEKGFAAEHLIEGKEAADEVVKKIRGQGGRSVSVAGDLSETETITEIYDLAEKEFGQVDILVNNAAHCEMPDNVFSVTAGNIDRHFAVNTRAAVLLVAEFVRRFKERGGKTGSVINVSTDAAQNFPTQISYGASKAALEAYTRSLALEIGPLGITVNAVAPGPVQTGYITPDLEETLKPQIPLRRVGEPEDIADVIVFLSSEKARWLTGQVIKVSGGHAI